MNEMMFMFFGELASLRDVASWQVSGFGVSGM
jgi:hypothetical protein